MANDDKRAFDGLLQDYVRLDECSDIIINCGCFLLRKQHVRIAAVLPDKWRDLLPRSCCIT